MIKPVDRNEAPMWVRVMKGWFFGTLSICTPFLLLMLVSMLFVEFDTGMREMVLGLIFVPMILFVQGIIIGVVVSFGLRIAKCLGF